MYSPEIRPSLIPVLYRAARSRGVPMTKLVDELLRDALSHRHDSLGIAHEALAGFPAKKINPNPKRRNQHAQSLYQLQQEGPDRTAVQ